MAQTHFSGPLAVGEAQFEVVEAAKTLSRKDSGKTFIVTGTGYTLTLPSITNSAGMWFRFVVRATFGTDFIVNGGDSLIHGAVNVESTRINWTGASLFNIQDGVEVIGDWVELWSDGTNWYIDGDGKAASSITAT